MRKEVQTPIRPASAPPCPHNSWDNVRIKKGITTLRCRQCQTQWKASHSKIQRCKDFVDGTCTNADCSLVHIHPFKQNLHERVNAHGKSVLRNVPHYHQQKIAPGDDAQSQSEEASPGSPYEASVSDASTMLNVPRLPMRANSRRVSEDSSLYSTVVISEPPSTLEDDNRTALDSCISSSSLRSGRLPRGTSSVLCGRSERLRMKRGSESEQSTCLSFQPTSTCLSLNATNTSLSSIPVLPYPRENRRASRAETVDYESGSDNEDLQNCTVMTHNSMSSSKRRLRAFEFGDTGAWMAGLPGAERPLLAASSSRSRNPSISIDARPADAAAQLARPEAVFTSRRHPSITLETDECTTQLSPPGKAPASPAVPMPAGDPVDESRAPETPPPTSFSAKTPGEQEIEEDMWNLVANDIRIAESGSL
ncbi:hypothetical protein DIPPA_26178 [Diplonema papillatum]|nr:hypothetical protein DIPPA_26178 [Diplonema papillatum]